MTHEIQLRSLFFFQMKPRPRARFLCYSKDFDTYSIQTFFFFFASRGAPADCAVLAENKLQMRFGFLRNAAGIPHWSHQDGKFEPV